MQEDFVENVTAIDEVIQLQEEMVALIRAFGLHEPDRTPCGQPMSVSEAHALMELDNQSRLLSQNELAVRLRLEKSTVSRLVAQLQRRGWVDQDPASNDGRVRLLTLTEAGQRAANLLSQARRSKYERLFSAIPEEEREAVFHAFKVVTSALSTDDMSNSADENQEREGANATQ